MLGHVLANVILLKCREMCEHDVKKEIEKRAGLLFSERLRVIRNNH